MRRSSTSSRSDRVRFAALALALVLPASAYGQGATNPTFTRIQQGASVEGVVVSCTTSSTNLLNCPTASAGAGDYRAVTCLNDGSNKVYVCANTDPLCTCVAASAPVSLAAGSAFTFGASSKSLQLSCITSVGSSTVRCIAER